jgi:hypothetical protein
MAMLQPDARPHRKLSRSIAGRRRGRNIVSAGIAPEARPRTARRLRARGKVRAVVAECSGTSGRLAPRRRLREIGIVTGKDLSPQKVGILLMLALSMTSDIGRDQRAFQTRDAPLGKAKQYEVISLAKDPPISVALANEPRFSQGERDHTGSATSFGLAFWSG